MGERPGRQPHVIILVVGITVIVACTNVVGKAHADGAAGGAVAVGTARSAAEATVMKFTTRIEFGEDVGQNFGSLFEVPTRDGRLVIGAGFMGLYNTHFRSDRYTVQFFIRPTHGEREFATDHLPRPCDDAGTYLFDLDGKLYSHSHAHDKTVRWWNEGVRRWEADPSPVYGRMRLGDGMLLLGDGQVHYNGNPILTSPEQGAYNRFYYALGHLFFYHTYWAEKSGYRTYEADSEGFSRLYACPWTPGGAVEEGSARSRAQGSGEGIDLSRAIVETLPVVGETTFAYGQLGGNVLTCSNIGGLYLFDGQAWKTLVEPQVGRSYQIYSMLNFYDRLLMGHYPTGLLYEFDGEKVTLLEGWPPRLAGVAPNAREAQTTAIYAGDLFVGVWPWGELWRQGPDTGQWYSVGRMFTHPPVTDETTHPYEKECVAHELVANQWGQRVTSLVPSGDSLMVSTSAKWPCEWEPRFDFLPDGKWQEYGSVMRLRTPGNLCASVRRTQAATELQFILNETEMRIMQDGEELASAKMDAGRGAGGGKRLATGDAGLAAEVAKAARLEQVAWGCGVFGLFAGATLDGKAETRTTPPSARERSLPAATAPPE